MINELFIVKRCTESQSENFARLVRFYNPQILYRTEYKKKKKNMQVLNRKKGTKNKKKTRNTGVAPSAMLERNYLNRYLYRPPPPPDECLKHSSIWNRFLGYRHKNVGRFLN